MPNMRQEPRAAAHSFPVGPGRASGAKPRRLLMRHTLLAGVAALSFVGATGAQAQTIYTTNPVYTADPAYTTGVYTTGSNVVVSQPNVIATAPGQVYPGQVYAVPA